MPPIIAVDLGGTRLRVARFLTSQPEPESVINLATDADAGPEAVLQKMIDAIGQLAAPATPGLRIGVAAPGPLDPQRGLILSTPNLPGWNEFPLVERLHSHFQSPVLLGNDANLAALAEWKHGAGRGTQDLVYLTVSTGIGGGAIVNGRLLVGARGLAGEFGHILTQLNGPRCGCGQFGHIEALAAGPAIARQALARIKAGEASSLSRLVSASQPLTAREVSLAAADGDALALEIYQNAGTVLGCHLASLAHTFDPALFVLGGGVSQAGAVLFDPLRASLQAHIMHPAFLRDLQVVPAALGERVGLIGAMLLGSGEYS